jgi:hypothetical protein
VRFFFREIQAEAFCKALTVRGKKGFYFSRLAGLRCYITYISSSQLPPKLLLAAAGLNCYFLLIPLLSPIFQEKEGKREKEPQGSIQGGH